MADTYTRIATGDALAVLRQLPAESIHCCVTSPPYWMLRDYGVDGQIGLETTPQEYIGRLMQVFDEVWRTLRHDGTCWVVIGDTYFGSNKGVGYTGPAKERFRFQQLPHVRDGKAKCLGLIPQRFAIAMTDRGWILRNALIWHKPNAIPSSVKDRFTVDYEDVFFFTKSGRYYFEQQFIPYKVATANRIQQFLKNNESFDPMRHKNLGGQARMAILERLAHKNLHIPLQPPHGMHRRRVDGRGEAALRVEGANMRTVWTIPVGRCLDAHFAVYPEKLIEIPIKAGCPQGGIVLDPFCGAGTTAIVSERLGRSFCGIELNPDYVDIAKRRIRQARDGG